MIKIINKEFSEPKTIEMGDMLPLQVAIITDKKSLYYNHIIMRTQSTTYFEIMNLSNSKIDACWSNKNNPTKVTLLTEPITVEISND